MKNKDFGLIVEVMCMKNQLLVLDEKTLSEIYLQNKDGMIDIVTDALEHLLYEEEVFFYLDESLIDKALYIVGELKGEPTDNSTRLNMMIPRIHEIKNKEQSFKDMKLVSYIEYESNIRNTYLDVELLKNCIQFDAMVAYYLLEDIDINMDDKDYILSSINYILNVCPEIFKDENNRQKLEVLFNKINKKIGLNISLKLYLRDTTKLYKKIAG